MLISIFIGTYLAGALILAGYMHEYLDQALDKKDGSMLVSYALGITLWPMTTLLAIGIYLSKR